MTKRVCGRAAIRALCLVLGTLLGATPAAAIHRKTPPLVQFTNTGDSGLPRLPPLGFVLALSQDDGNGGRQIVRYQFPYLRAGNTATLTKSGHNDDPVINFTGGVVAWDSDADLLGDGSPSGHQIFMQNLIHLVQVTNDPTGTSVHPTISEKAPLLAFDSTGDLAKAGNPPGIRQIFLLRTDDFHNIVQVSRGTGVSQNPMLSYTGHTLVFESTSDPATGLDTALPQVWGVTGLPGAFGSPTPVVITDGQGPSTGPQVSEDDKVIVFQSSADLIGDGHDTGVTQIFARYTPTSAIAQLTNDPAGCSGPSVHVFRRDWRIAFVCAGEPVFHLLRVDQQFQFPFSMGNTVAAMAALNFQFIVMSTTSNPRGLGTTPGHEIYLWNLFKKPLAPVASHVEHWKPFAPWPVGDLVGDRLAAGGTQPAGGDVREPRRGVRLEERGDICGIAGDHPVPHVIDEGAAGWLRGGLGEHGPWQERDLEGAARDDRRIERPRGEPISGG